MGPGIGDAIGEGIITLIALAFTIGAVLMAALILGVPWLWELLKPWLHAVTA